MSVLSEEKRNRLKLKIQALLNKNIGNDCSESEMESALNKAKELMDKYYITIKDLEDPFLNEKCVYKRVKQPKSKYKMRAFLGNLAKFFDVEYYYNQQRFDVTVTFFGLKQDVEVCSFIYEVITNTCISERIAYTESDEYYLHKMNYSGSSLNTSFVVGFINKINKRLDDMNEEKVYNADVNGYGLMVVGKNELVTKQFKKFAKVKTVKVKHYNNIVGEALVKGSKSGDKVNFNSGIETSKKNNLSIYVKQY